MTNDDQYVLSVDEVRAAWVGREFEFGDTTDRASVDFDRFLARVRRDAAREAEARVAEEKHLRMKATAAATKAEARIEAVQHLIDQADEMGEWAITCTRLQWAIDGSAPQPGA